MPGPIATTFTGMSLSPVLAGVTMHLGRQWLRVEEAPPRVVWVPANEPWLPPGGYSGDALDNPRTIWRRTSQWEAHCWGADFDGTEDLIQRVAQACHYQMWTGFYYEIKGGAWVVEEGSSSKLGEAYVLTIEFLFPVTMPTVNEAAILTTPFTTAEQHADGTLVLNV